MRNLKGFTSINVGFVPIDMFNPAVVLIGCTVFPIGWLLEPVLVLIGSLLSRVSFTYYRTV